jgi:hypothetical protein
MLRPFYDASVRESRCSSVPPQSAFAPTGPGPGSTSTSEGVQDQKQGSGSQRAITPASTNPKPATKPGPSRSASSSSNSSGRSRSVSGTCSRRILMGIKNEDSTRPVVDNHGAGTHFVCQDEAGLAGPYDALGEFDQVSRSSVRALSACRLRRLLI